MKSLLLFTTVVCLANCFNDDLIITRSSTPENQANLGIYDGKNMTIEKIPSLVSLIVYGNLECAGTIVSDRWVVTDGDCVHNVDASSVGIVAASVDGVTGDKYKVAKVVQHPKYYKPPMDFDVALLQTAEPFNMSRKVQPAKLPKGPTKANATVNVAGYGAVSPHASGRGQANGQLMGGVMFWQSTAFCKKTYKDFGFEWTPRMGCIYNKGKTTMCSHDFGGPAMSGDTLDGWFVAVASSGFCSPDAAPAIVTSAWPVARWIAKITGATTAR